jgi:multidrug efflux pump subunit AcrB
MLKQPVSSGSLATWSVYHPLGVIMIALSVVVLGFVLWSRLGIDLLPHLIYPEIRVRVIDRGVPAIVMENQVTRQLEEQLAITEDAISIQSTTSEGRSEVDLAFPYGKDIDIALRDASTRLDRAKRFLPDTIEPPIIYKRDPSQIPVLTLVVSSPLRDPVELRTWVDKQLSKWFITLPGVAAAEVGGGLVREIQVLPDQQRLVAFGLSLADLVTALKQANVEQASGRLYMPTQEISTRVAGRWQQVEDIAAVRLSAGGASKAVYLGEVAQIIDTHQDERIRVRFNGIPGIKLSIQKQPQANTVAVVDQVLQRITWLQNQHILPADVQIDVVDNRASYVRQALTNATTSALLGALLAMLVVYLFLGHLRHTLIIGTAIPLAITVTIILMVLGNLTLNIMTLGGLALGIGMVVDNTIVMLENITRHQQNTSSLLQGSLKAISEITSALIAATSTNLAAILPFLFIVGLVGLLFRELIVTISAAMVASLVVALTVVPALAGGALNERQQTTSRLHFPNFEQTGWLYPLESRLKRIYSWIIKKLLRWPIIVIMVFVSGLGWSVSIFWQGQQIFLPDLDDGRIFINMTAEAGIALQAMDNLVIQVENYLQQQPEVASVFTQMGGFIFGRSQHEASNRSSLDVQLVPFKQRALSTDQWLQKMKREFQQLQLVGVAIRMRSAGIRGIRLGRGEEDFSLRLQGPDLQRLIALASEVLERLTDIPGLSNLKHSAEEIRQEFTVSVDRQRANALGFTVADVGRDLNILLNGQIVTYFLEGDQQIEVRLRLPRHELQNPKDLQAALLYNAANRAVRLDEIAQLQWLPVPSEISRDQQQRIIEISGNISTATSLPTVMAAVQQRLENWNLPEKYTLYEGGAAQALQASQQLTQTLLGLAIFLVFVVMAVQYESLRNPLIILCSVPFASIGVAIGIQWLEMPLSMPVWLGMIMLAGIVVNNAIVLVETIELQRASGLPMQSAIMRAGELRLRPILMTTLTTVTGLLPLAFNLGESAKMLQPLAVTIAFGLSFSLLVSLFLVPVFYRWLTPLMTSITSR